MATGKNPYLSSENDLPKNLVPVETDAGPVGAPAPPLPHDMPPFFSGSMPPQLQHDTTFVGTKIGSPRIPSHDLMPLGLQANPATNAAIQSTSTKVVDAAIAAIPPAESTDIESIFTNVQSVAQYVVQLSDRVKLVSMNNNSGGTVVLPGGTITKGTFEHAVTNNGNSGTASASGTPFTGGGTALLFSIAENAGSVQSPITFTPGPWTALGPGGGNEQLYTQVLPSSATPVSVSATISPSGSWATTLAFFQNTTSISLVQRASGGGGGIGPGTYPVVFGSNTVKENSILVFMTAASFTNGIGGTHPGVATPTDTAGNTYKLVGIVAGPATGGPSTFFTGQTWLWIAENVAGGADTVNFVLTGTEGSIGGATIFAYEISLTGASTSTGFDNGWYCYIENTGSGTFNVVSAAQIDGVSGATIALGPNSGVIAAFDGTNWFTERGAGGGGTVVTSFNGRTGAVVPQTGDYTQTQIAAGAIANGTTATTQAANDNSTKLATTAYVDGAGFATKVGVQNESYTYASDTGSANAYAIAPSPAIAAYVAGQSFTFLAAHANTTTSTLAVSGLAAKTIKKLDGATNLSTGDILAGQIVTVVYDGTNFQMISELGTFGGALSNGSTATTQSAGDNTSKVATDAFVTTAVANVISGTTPADGLRHGDTVWPVDDAWIGLRDDFIRYTAGASQFTGTQNTDIGELGWALVGTVGNSNNGLFVGGGAPPNMGQFTWCNNATLSNFGGLMLNYANSSNLFSTNAFPLLDFPGWKCSWVFKFDSDYTQTPPELPSFNKKSFYVGLMGSAASLVATGAAARPDTFIGLRFDTSTTPAGYTVTSVAAGTGVYTGTFGGAGTNGLVGMNLVCKGFANAANNGTFPITANTTTTITVTNASSVLETVTPAGSAWVVPASIPSTGTAGAASGGNTVYNILALTGITTNSLIGMTLVVTGFVASSGANNGTFTVVSNTTTTVTLNNAAGVSETHAGFLTGGNLNTTNFQFEMVQNRLYNVAVRHNAIGTVVDSGVAPVAGTWYRLDMSSTVSGQVVCSLNGGATHSFTFSTQAFSSNGSAVLGGNGISALISFANGATGTASFPMFASGSPVTISGLTGGNAVFNGATTLVGEISPSSQGTIIFPNSNVVGSTTASNQIVTGFPALTPVCAFGNDDTAAPIQNLRMFVDFFALVWNKGIVSPTNTPDATKARYW